MNLKQKLRQLYPLTVFGSLLWLAALLLLGQAVVARDRHGQILAWAAIALLAVLAAVGRLMVVRFQTAKPQLTSASALSASRPSGLLAVVPSLKLPPFFYVHIRLKGSLTAGEHKLYSFSREYRLKRKLTTLLELSPPLCGRLNYKAEFRISDFLGLTVWRLDQAAAGSVPVQPAYLELPVAVLRSAADSRDAKPPLKPSLEEKIFVREYQAGDLSRDINWKAAGRIQKLLTRIPPTARQDSQHLELLIRTAMSDLSSFTAHCHLAALKTIVCQFLVQARRTAPACSFRILLNRQEYCLDANSQLDSFIADLCDSGPCPTFAPMAGESTTARLFVFSTCFDKGLDDELSLLDSRLVQLFITRPATADQADFSVQLWPGDWVFKPRVSLWWPGPPLQQNMTAAVAARQQFSVKALYR